MLPLEGITVVALEQAVAAPFATRQLADLGARVIKIERPGTGDFARHYDRTVRGMSSHFVWLNRSKESLALNLKHPAAGEIMDALLEQADVFIQNLAPGAAERLQLGTETLSERFPRLIICNVSGFGPSGPYSEKKAYDLLIQCETGLVSITGSEDTPSKTGISVADIAGGMYAYSSILTSLLQRHQTGKGTVVDVSLFDALAEWMGYPMYYTRYGGSAPLRTGARHASISPYGPFAAGDGKTVFLAIQNEREWERFCTEVLQQPEVATDRRFLSNSLGVKHHEALRELILTVFRGQRAAEIIHRLDRAQIASAELRDVDAFLEHPQLWERNRVRKVNSPAGEIDALLPPVILRGIQPVMNPIPEVGEHSEAILRELGFPSASIQRWSIESVIG